MIASLCRVRAHDRSGKNCKAQDIGKVVLLDFFGHLVYRMQKEIPWFRGLTREFTAPKAGCLGVSMDEGVGRLP